MKNNIVILLQAFTVDNKGLFAMGKKINIKVVSKFRATSADNAAEVFLKRPDANMCVYRDAAGDVFEYLPLGWKQVKAIPASQRNFNFNGVRL